MSNDVKPIYFALNAKGTAQPGVAQPTTTEASLLAPFAVVDAALTQASLRREGAVATAHTQELLAAIRDFLVVADALDLEYGHDARLPIDDLGEAVDEALRCAAELDSIANQLALTEVRGQLGASVIGIGLWCMRHALAIQVPAPIVNALAERSNVSTTRQDVAAVFALMQGILAHLTPALEIDLERSNPDRPWRVLNLNFAITAIRTGDEAMMRYAFERLNHNLPDERRGFYEAAYSAAQQPDFPTPLVALIESELVRATTHH